MWKGHSTSVPRSLRNDGLRKEGKHDLFVSAIRPVALVMKWMSSSILGRCEEDYCQFLKLSYTKRWMSTGLWTYYGLG